MGKPGQKRWHGLAARGWKLAIVIGATIAAIGGIWLFTSPNDRSSLLEQTLAGTFLMLLSVGVFLVGLFTVLFNLNTLLSRDKENHCDEEKNTTPESDKGAES